MFFRTRNTPDKRRRLASDLRVPEIVPVSASWLPMVTGGGVTSAMRRSFSPEELHVLVNGTKGRGVAVSDSRGGGLARDPVADEAGRDAGRACRSASRRQARRPSPCAGDRSNEKSLTTSQSGSGRLSSSSAAAQLRRGGEVVLEYEAAGMRRVGRNHLPGPYMAEVAADFGTDERVFSRAGRFSSEA